MTNDIEFEEKKIKIFNGYADDLLSCKVIESALKTLVYRKLNLDKCFCPKQCIDGITIDAANKAMGEAFAKYTITQNTKDELLLRLRKCTDLLLDYYKSKLVLYYILNLNLTESPSSNNKDNLSNSSYAKVIKNLLEQSGLITSPLKIENDELLCFNEYTPKRIKTVDEFIKKIETIYDKYKTDDTEVFFRGQSNINYITLPGIFRDERFYNNESQMYRDIILKCPNEFEKFNTKFGRLSFMQHYGLPTRLLDVTANALVALYFACESKESINSIGEVEVYIVDKSDIKYPSDVETKILSCIPLFDKEDQRDIYKCCNSKQNEISKDFVNEVNTEKIISEDAIKNIVCKKYWIIPKMDNTRIARQKGAFVFFGLTEEYSLVEGLGNYKSKEIIYISSKKDKERITNCLRHIGVDRSFVYPEISDVVKDIKEIYN